MNSGSSKGERGDILTSINSLCKARKKKLLILNKLNKGYILWKGEISYMKDIKKKRQDALYELYL